MLSNQSEAPTGIDSAQLFKVLAHPSRLAILNLLRDGEHCVCHLEAHLGYRQAYISQQLAVLRQSGLIKDRRDGWNIFYSINNSRIFELLDSASMISGVEPWNAGDNVKCPCPSCNSK